MYSELGMGFIKLNNINEILGKKSENKLVKYWNITFGGKKKEVDKIDQKNAQKISTKKPFLLKMNIMTLTISLRLMYR